MPISHYDVIGDIHGHAEALHELLNTLGYIKKAGVYSHPAHKTLFVGDLIDRGPGQLDVLQTVRAMVESGQAQMVMGNHEFNAIGWFFRNQAGSPYRPHIPKNLKQHQMFLDAVGENSPHHRDWIQWFMSLPLWLKLPDLNLVHACWCQESMQTLTPFLTPAGTLIQNRLEPLFAEGAVAYNAAEAVLKGPELLLPSGTTFKDKEGHVRDTTRIKWWLDKGTLRDITIVPLEQEPLVLPQLPDQDMTRHLKWASALTKPTFIGHYWLQGEPGILSDLVACLDYSVAKDGKLAAYRHTGGEPLSDAEFIAIETQ